MSFVFEQLTKTSEFQALSKLSEEMERKRKPNPNNYPIVDKWNYKYAYLPYQSRLYRTIEMVFNVGFPAAYEAEIENFADINEVDKGVNEIPSLPSYAFTPQGFKGLAKKVAEETYKRDVW